MPGASSRSTCWNRTHDAVSILAHVRPSFEREAGQELQALAREHHLFGHLRVMEGSGLCELVLGDEDADRLVASAPFVDLVFVRQWLVSIAQLRALVPGDRVSAIVAALPKQLVFDDLCVESGDGDEGRRLGRLCRSITQPLRDALADRLVVGSGLRAHVVFTSGDSAYVGYAPVENSSAWPKGIPRLRLPRGAPSRASAKLEEGILWFLGSGAEGELRAGMSAVDLGAAPGGWSWSLTRRGLDVVAVDKAALAPELLASGFVEHVERDAFTFKPGNAVDWCVCDIADKPARVADLMCKWLENRWCRWALFNLKLPMASRYESFVELRERMTSRLGEHVVLRFKQLYHDRAEVTGCAQVLT